MSEIKNRMLKSLPTVVLPGLAERVVIASVTPELERLEALIVEQAERIEELKRRINGGGR